MICIAHYDVLSCTKLVSILHALILDSCVAIILLLAPNALYLLSCVDITHAAGHLEAAQHRLNLPLFFFLFPKMLFSLAYTAHHHLDTISAVVSFHSFSLSLSSNSYTTTTTKLVCVKLAHCSNCLYDLQKNFGPYKTRMYGSHWHLIVHPRFFLLFKMLGGG